MMRDKLYGWLCDAIHVGLGVLVALCYDYWVLALIGAYLFVEYQLSEEKRIKDFAYKDLKEFMFGFFVTVILLLGGVMWT